MKKRGLRDMEAQWEYWASSLTPEFVEFAQGMKFARYLCPGNGCNEHI